jgi:hypothetical protein
LALASFDDANRLGQGVLTFAVELGERLLSVLATLRCHFTSSGSAAFSATRGKQQLLCAAASP